MNTLISKLLLIINSEPKESTNYILAKYILDHLDEIPNMPVNQLAEACFSSSNSIRKFCRFLGYESYSRLKEALSSSVITRKEQIRERYGLYNPDALYEQIHFIIPETDIGRLKQELEHAASMIAQYDGIALCGAVYPLMLTLNFQEDMIIFGKKISILKSMNGKIDETALRDDELLFVITVTGRMIHLNPGNLNVLKRHAAHTILVSQISPPETRENHIQIPGTADDERYNILLIYMFNLLKYLYYTSYGSLYGAGKAVSE